METSPNQSRALRRIVRSLQLLPWTGKDLRKAHANLPGLNETHFNAIAENLKSTLEDLKVKEELVDQVMAVAGSVKDDVLNRPKLAK